jgi:hypothetical protein
MTWFCALLPHNKGGIMSGKMKFIVGIVAGFCFGIALLLGDTPSTSKQAWAASSAACKQWEVNMFPATPGKIEPGWEPISSVMYGKGGTFGILVRRCAD